MIAVIADDFTGAAEMAGIGLRYGLRSIIAINGNTVADVDLLVICTDSRSLPKDAAREITKTAIQNILALKPEWVYKKIDSVFRGHVLDELDIQLQESGLKKALVVGANPSLGRTIKNGEYFIDERLIVETGFASDPEFAVTSSSVLKMLKAGNNVQVLKRTDVLSDGGIVIGEAISTEDVKAWADIVTNDWVLAGAGDFFTALLQRRYKETKQSVATIELPHLYISGTSFDKRKNFIKELDKQLNCVVYLDENENWLENAVAMLRSQRKLVVAIDKANNQSALLLRTSMAKAVRYVIENTEVKELFIEGGSTAGAILDELQLTHFYPVNELSRGVVRMKANNLYITVKPGSYELPRPIEQLYSVK